MGRFRKESLTMRTKSLASKLFAIVALGACGLAFAAGGPSGAWQHWAADVEIDNLGSMQRGARNFMSYCVSCHTLKYARYSRVAEDLKISPEQLEQFLLKPDAKPSDYITNNLQPADAAQWFGTAPPDLSLISRSKGADHVYRFMKTFYADPSKPTGVNNLALEGTAMPHVLAELQGVQTAVFRNEDVPGEGGKTSTRKVWEKFEIDTAGSLSAAEYVGEPVQAKRQRLGVWVVLFLLLFTALAYLLNREYWRDIR
jgi:ubiquinol-cytochrome c reductase cytochrome c1 subunit